MVLFDEFGALKKYEAPEEIIKQFYDIRLEYYQKRKDYLEGSLKAEADKLSNQARFIVEKCNQTLIVENKKRKTIVDELKRRGYDPDPIKEWKRRVKDEEDDEPAEEGAEDGEDTQDEEDTKATSKKASKKPEDTESTFNRLPDVQKYGYLLGMSMWMLTEERKNELLKQRDQKLLELEVLKAKTPSMLWREDLDVFMKNLDELEEKERNEEAGLAKKLGKNAPKMAKGKKLPSLMETLPSPQSRRIIPIVHNEIKKKAMAANKAKENKIKREQKHEIVDLDEEKDEFDEMVKNKKTLKDKVGTPEELERKAGIVKGRKKAADKGSGDGLKQTKLEFKKRSPAKNNKSSPKKGGSRKHFSSDESDAKNVSDSDLSDADVSFSTATTVEGTQPRAKRNVKAIKYDAFADSASSDDDAEPVLYDNKLEETFVQKPMDVSSDSEPEEQAPPQRMETSEDMFDSLVGRKESPPEADKKAPKTVKNYDSDEFLSDDDMMPLTEKLELQVQEAVKKTADAAPKEKPAKAPKEKVVKEKVVKEKAPPKERKKKAPAGDSDGKKKKEAKKRKKAFDSDGSMSEEDIFADNNKGGKKSKKGDDDSDEDFEIPVSRGGGGRARKPAKYNFDDSDSDSD